MQQALRFLRRRLAPVEPRWYNENRKDESLNAAENALALTEELGLDGSITMGTMCINAATAYKAFGDAEKALPLYL